jgi:hypothetical protein
MEIKEKLLIKNEMQEEDVIVDIVEEKEEHTYINTKMLSIYLNKKDMLY